MKLSVHIAPVPDLKYRDSLFDVVDFVNHVVANANSPALPIAKFLAAAWSRSVAEFKDSCFNGIVYWGVQSGKLFFRVRQYAKRVTNLLFLSRSILSTASSNGTGVSPEAMASSYARISSRSSSSSRIFSYSSILRTTATFSPRSFTTNWRSLPIGSSLSAVYSGLERRAIQTKLACSKVLFVVGRGSHLQHGEERFLRNVNLADALHAALAFFLFLEEFAFAGNVTAVAFGENVFADGRDGFARNDAAADRGLDRNLEHLPRNKFPQARHQIAPALRRKVAMDDQRQRIHRFAGDQHIQLDQVGFPVVGKMVVERSVAA